MRISWQLVREKHVVADFPSPHRLAIRAPDVLIIPAERHRTHRDLRTVADSCRMFQFDRLNLGLYQRCRQSAASLSTRAGSCSSEDTPPIPGPAPTREIQYRHIDNADNGTNRPRRKAQWGSPRLKSRWCCARVNEMCKLPDCKIKSDIVIVRSQGPADTEKAAWCRSAGRGRLVTDHFPQMIELGSHAGHSALKGFHLHTARL